MNVQIEGASFDSDPHQGIILVNIVNQNTDGRGNLGVYTGGEYPTPQKLGPVTLTGVTGSPPTGNMVISFSYAGGSGRLNPKTGHFRLSWGLGS